MSLETILDYIGNRVTGVTGVKVVYGAAASVDPDDVLPIPMSLDVTPVCLVWPGGGTLAAGNTERFTHDIDLYFWDLKENIGTALTSTVPLVDRCRVLFRTDVDAGANATWVLMRGYDRPTDETINGVTYLVLAIRLQALEINYGSSYAA